VAVTSQKKTLKNPNKEDSGATLFHSIATTAGKGEDNSNSSPPTPEQTPGTPRPCRKPTAPGETALPRSADLRGKQASSSPTPPQVALPRWESSSDTLIPMRRRLHHPDDVSRNPNQPQDHPLVFGAPHRRAAPPHHPWPPQSLQNAVHRWSEAPPPRPGRNRRDPPPPPRPQGFAWRRPQRRRREGDLLSGGALRWPTEAPRCGPARPHGDGGERRGRDGGDDRVSSVPHHILVSGWTQMCFWAQYMYVLARHIFIIRLHNGSVDPNHILQI
jgi:hypothetical protein